MAESREALTRQVALQLQIALTAWNELYPDDSDEDACEKSLQIVEQGLDEVLNKQESTEDAEAEEEDEPLSDEDVSSEEEDPVPRRRPSTSPPPPPARASQPPPPTAAAKFAPSSFRDLLIEMGREFPGGFDITTVIDEAEGRGWSHSNPRQYVSLVASQLVRSGILARKDRGMYALSEEMQGPTKL